MPNHELPIVSRLSKSKYLSGLQCHKRLYLEIHSPDLGELDEAEQARMEMGAEVGELARKRFPNGMLVEWDHLHLPDALKRTAELVSDPHVPAILEGAFEADNVLVRVDILERVGHDQWRVIEVKATAEVKEHHPDDLAIQVYVLKRAGISVAGAWLMHINNQYVYQGGELDLEQLFVLDDLTEEVAQLQAKVPAHLPAMREMLAAAAPPSIEPDGHCESPYACQFWTHCTKDKPARWIYYLPRIGKKFDQLRKLGVESIDDIPHGFGLSVPQQRMKDNAEWIGSQLKAELEQVQYPIHYLDFESLSPAIPRYPMSRPYQQIPFQWSCLTEYQDGTVRHREFIWTDRTDPREQLAVELLQTLGKEGTVCVFYAPFERGILAGLGERLPVLRPDLAQLIIRLWDLQDVIRDHYYHPGFRGLCSLKNVLPAVLPSLSYSDLEIQEGGMASLQYYRMIFEVTDPGEKDRIRQALLKYCERDALAMVELRRVLLAKAEGASS